MSRVLGEGPRCLTLTAANDTGAKRKYRLKVLQHDVDHSALLDVMNAIMDDAFFANVTPSNDNGPMGH